MQNLEFFVIAVYSIIFSSVFIENIEANSRDLATRKDGKVIVNFDDLVIEVTPPRGRESILNTEPFYEQWQNVDDVAYWESIYGSMDNIPAFEDLPEIIGETFELKHVREWDEESSDLEDTKSLDSDISKHIMEKSPNSMSTIKEKKPSEDRCMRINPFYPQKRMTSRQKRATASPKNEADSDELKRKARTLSLLHGESGKYRLKSALQSNRRPDYFFNKYGRKNHRQHKSGYGFSSLYDCPENGDGETKSVRMVDSAINAAELVNSKFARGGQVVGDMIANAARQLAQAKHDVIDLGLGGIQAIGSGSLNNAETDCLGEGVHAGEANIDSVLEVVGNSVLDTNSGIINDDTGIADEIKVSSDMGTSKKIDTAVESLVVNYVDEAEIVGASLKENSDGNIEISEPADESNSEVIIVEDQATENIPETVKTDDIVSEVPIKENIPEILQNVEILSEPQIVSEDILKLGDNDVHKVEMVGTNLETSGNDDVATEVVEDDGLNANAAEEVANTEKSDAEEIVGSSLKINTVSGVQASINAGKSTDLKDIDNNRNHEKARRVHRPEDFSCECGRFSEEDKCHLRDFFSGRYYDRNQKFDGPRYLEDHRYHENRKNYHRTQESGMHADAGLHKSLNTEINTNSNHGSKSLHAGVAASLDLHSNLDIAISPKSGIHISSGIHKSSDTNLDINTDRDAGIHAGRKSSQDIDSKFDIGHTRSRLDQSHHRHYDDYGSNEYNHDYEQSNENREYRRRFPEDRQYYVNHRDHHGSRNSGIHTDAGIHSSLNADIDINSNHGSKSLHAGAATSSDHHSNLDIGISPKSGIHASSSVHKSSDTSLDINSDRNAGIHAGAKSALDIDSNLDIGHARSKPHGPHHRYAYFNSNEDSSDYEESIEDREYRRRFPETHGSYSNNKDYQRKMHDSGIHTKSGIHTSLNAGLNVNTDLRNTGLHANSGIHSALDATAHLNSDVAADNFNTKSRGSNIRDENYRNYNDERDQDVSSEYDDESKYWRRFPETSYRDYSSPYHGRKSGILANSGIHTSLDTGVDINSPGAVGGLHAGAKSSLDLESHLDIGATSLGVNGANPLHQDVINPKLRVDGEIHTSHSSRLDVNAGGHLHTGMKSSLDHDSHLDIGTSKPSGVDERSGIQPNVKTSNGKLGVKICEAACRRISDSREDTAWSNSRFDNAYDGRSEYPESLPCAERDAPYYMCDNCRRRLYGGIDRFCPICGRSEDPFEDRHFLSSGTMYHFDGSKQNCKRTANSRKTCSYPGYNHHINLDANCTDEAVSHSPDCQGMDYDLQTPRDGNPVPLGFVRTHLSHGHDIALDMHDRAKSLVAGGLNPSPHTASMLHFFQNKVPDDLVRLNEESELTLFGTKLLQQKLSVDYNITPNSFLEFLNHHGFRVTGDRICRGRRKRCGDCDKFRCLDGSCNNIDHPTWGQSNRAFTRILSARYSDGIHGMPVSVTGAELPSPRKLSVRFYSRNGKLDPELTLAVVQWGQTLAHDLAFQVMDQTTKGGIECCGDNGKSQLPKSLQHHSCAPISISPRDKFYSSHGQRCMNFVRAMTVTREDCTLGPADQLNGATSFLDCSPMYGVDKTTSDELREFVGGRMKVEFRNGRWMLPTMRNHSNFCDIWSSDDVCYKTGDPRSNQNPQLVILQTLLVREHNRVANGLSALNPDWNDERIFQEARRIVIAEYQHITYNEWLPLLLGKRYCKKHGLVRTESGMSNAYDKRVNPSTIIGFTSGAFRSLHSMIEGDLGLCNARGDFVDKLRLSDHYFRPRVIEKNNNFEHLLRGLTTQRMQKQNMQLHSELTEYLFRSRNDYGMDLAAIDIQRGRDHGVPGYNAYRKICRLRPAQDFDDLFEEISWENIEKLRRDYAHVDDIDLIVGTMMENRAPGSHFGPTNRCLIGEQFYRSRVGDRFFYDNEKFPHSFTPEQFDEIKKVSLSRLMCDMGGAVSVVQRYAFRAVSSKNPLIPCEDLPKLDLTYWIE